MIEVSLHNSEVSQENPGKLLKIQCFSNFLGEL